MAVAGVSSRPNPRRPPLLPSVADNGSRRPKYSEVTSRYLSPASSISTSTTATSSSYSSSSSSNSSSSRRTPSPLISRTVPGTPMSASSAAIRRSQSVEKKRPAAAANPRPSTPGRTGEVSAAVKLLVASSRSMSVSLQGTPFSHPVSKSKPTQTLNGFPFPSSRKGTPERRKATPAKDQGENSRPNAQHRWPGRSGDVNFLSRSLNCGYDTHKLTGSRSVVRQLQRSRNEEEISKSSLTDRLDDHSMNAELDTANSDSGSAQTISSGSIGNVKECAQVRGGPRGIVVPARFWQETTNRIQRKPERGSPMSKKNNVSKPADSSKFNTLKKSSGDKSTSSPQGVSTTRSLSSPLRGAAVRPASPSKFLSHSASPSRGTPSPVRVRNGAPFNLNSNASTASFVLSYAADIIGGKAGNIRVFDVLKLLHTRHLQLRFINARADAAMLARKETAEKSMYNAWVATLKLRRSVNSKRVELLRLRQSLKLYSILKRQILHLDVWNRIDRDHDNSLLGVTEALEASTLQLPVVSGARVDIQDLKDAIYSAVEVMQTMVSSIGVWLTKVDHVSSLASEIGNTYAKENSLLFQCKDIMSALTALQVKDCSIKTHMLQVRRLPSILKKQV